MECEDFFSEEALVAPVGLLDILMGEIKSLIKLRREEKRTLVKSNVKRDSQRIRLL